MTLYKLSGFAFSVYSYRVLLFSDSESNFEFKKSGVSVVFGYLNQKLNQKM